MFENNLRFYVVLTHTKIFLQYFVKNIFKVLSLKPYFVNKIESAKMAAAIPAPYSVGTFFQVRIQISTCEHQIIFLLVV